MDVNEHQLDDDGEHDPDECEVCYEHDNAIQNSCQCGNCCRWLIIEASFRDAEREPRIKELPTLKGFSEEPEGYLLNGPGGACVFLDQQTNLCTIYNSRPLICRVFCCDEFKTRDETTSSE